MSAVSEEGVGELMAEWEEAQHAMVVGLEQLADMGEVIPMPAALLRSFAKFLLMAEAPGTGVIQLRRGYHCGLHEMQNGRTLSG